MLANTYPGFEACRLDDTDCIWRARLADGLRAELDSFESLWALHPPDFHPIKMGGRWVQTPRWQQAYGADYRYTGHVNRGLPIPEALAPILTFVRTEIDARLNGLLLNWYDAERGHYIGPHRDTIRDLVRGAPIVTVSLGATRTFRLRRYQQKRERVDLTADDGSVLIIPFGANRRWTHEVPLFARDRGRRISITVRAFAGRSSDE